MAEAPFPVRPDVEVQPITHEGESLFLIQDPEGLATQPLGVAPGGLAVAGMFDGKRTVEDISEALFKETGQRVPVSVIAGLAAELENAGFLETPAVAQARAKLLKDFADFPKRKALHLGGYPDGGLELSAYIGQFYAAPKGPGAPAGKPQGAAPLGLFAPHIDLARGGPSYAWSYAELTKSPPPDAIVALGVAHMSPDSPWTFTGKEYETPYGAMKVDSELSRALSSKLWYEPTQDEWVHRREHSLEFQALWLRYIWKDACPPWVPILCSTFERWSPDRPPSSVDTVEKALKAMREAVAKSGKRVLILGGIDLAHVGPHFGDELQMGPELSARVEKEDRSSLEHALKGEADALYSSVVAGGHWRKWCGLSAGYTALRLMGEDARGSLLSYGQAGDPRGGLVSFASAVFR